VLPQGRAMISPAGFILILILSAARSAAGDANRRKRVGRIGDTGLREEESSH
jgi:hypothetical protein